MGFFDLSLPYSDQSRPGDKDTVIGKASRLKLATKAMELGYVGIAHNRTIKGTMSDKDSCTIPLLTLGSIIKLSPKLSSSVGFHRDLLGISRDTPFRQYTRVTVHVESKSQCQALNSGNPILKSYDLVAVRPLSQNAFDDVCGLADVVDIVSIDFDKMQFRLKYPLVKSALQRGVYFEIKYYDLLKDAQTRRQVISNVKLLVDWTKGKNLIISSGATSVSELRGPNDVINLMSLLGLSSERAKAAITKNCRNMIAKVLKKKRFHKEAVRVELVSSGEAFSIEKPMSEDCMKWDPLSSGEGDMLLADLAKAFDAAAANKSSKAIDFASVVDGLPSHGFRVTDIIGTDPLTHQSATNAIDNNPRGIETTSQIGLRKCITSPGPGQEASSLTLRRCTNSDTASDVKKHTGSDSEDKSLSSPSKSGHGISESYVQDLSMESTAVDEVVSVECGNDDDIKIEDMEVEEEKHETGEKSNDIILLNLSSETSDLLRESGESLSPQDQLESEKDPISIEDDRDKETDVESSETNSGTALRAKRSRVRLPQLQRFKPFLLQSRFKRIGKRGRRHRRRA